MKRKSLRVLMAVALVASLLVGCGTAAKEETDSRTATQSEADVPTTEVQETESADVSEEIVADEEPEVVEETTTEQTEEPMPEQTEEPEVTTEPTETAEPELQYTYTDLSRTMYATQTVNVRSLPSTDGEKIGSLSANQKITITGQCNETSWYRFELDGQTAFVSNSYISNEKVEIQQAQQTEQGKQPSDFPYPFCTPIDVGDGIFMYHYATPEHNMREHQHDGWDYNVAYPTMQERHDEISDIYFGGAGYIPWGDGDIYKDGAWINGIDLNADGFNWQ